MAGTAVTVRNVLRRLSRALALAALAVVVSAGAASPAVRVVGGTAIQIQSAPWAVFVAYYPGGDTQTQCTGSVLDASTILTAAHCLYGPTGTLAQPAQVSVEAGVSNYAAPAATDAEQDRVVSSFRIHPGYVFQETGLPDDLAVLTLSTPLDLSGPGGSGCRATRSQRAVPGRGRCFAVGLRADERGRPHEYRSARVDDRHG